MNLDILINKFLIFNGYSTSLDDFTLSYNSHPNYPSLYAITDTLSVIGIENVAAQVPKEQLQELPANFLAILEGGTEPGGLVFVKREAEKISVTTSKNKTVPMSIDDFTNKWSGMVVAIEPGEGSRKVSNYHPYVFALFILGLLGVYGLCNNFTLTIAIYGYCLSILGFLISILIIQEKLQTSKQASSGICSFSENTSCESVIRSDSTQIFKWLDFSDLPILFFGSSLLAHIIDTSVYGVTGLLSMLSVPIIIYSVYLQKVKLKKWCMLCLGISVLLLLNSVSFFAIGDVSGSSVLVYLAALAIVAAVWFFCKDYLEANFKLRADNNELSRFKRNYTVFDNLQTPLDAPLREAAFRRIALGSPSSVIDFTLIVSPSCGYCHSSIEQALSLYKTNNSKKGIKLTIFYNINPDNPNNPFLEIAKNAMQLNASNPEMIIEALSDWHLKRMDTKAWMGKWGQGEIDESIIEDLREQYKWCALNGLNFTPITILGENNYPKEYTIEELKYFVSEIESNHPAYHLDM